FAARAATRLLFFAILRDYWGSPTLAFALATFPLLVRLSGFVDTDQSFRLHWRATQVRSGGGYERFDQGLFLAELQPHRSHPDSAGVACGQRFVVLVSCTKHIVSGNETHCSERSPC